MVSSRWHRSCLAWELAQLISTLCCSQASQLLWQVPAHSCLPSSPHASAMLLIVLAHPAEPHVPICQYTTCQNVRFPLLTYCSLSTPFLTLQCLCTPCWHSEHAISTAGALIVAPGKYVSVVIYSPAAIPGVCTPEGCIAG